MRVRDVRAGFGEAEVLHGVSLDLVCGEVLALIGPNGAGKSTLLAVISGDLDPTGGAVQIDGAPLRDWSQAERAMRRSVLLQSVDVSFPFRVREVVEMGRAPWAGTGACADDERIVQVPVAVGGSLAEPGAIVDIIGESPVTIASASATPFATDGQADNSASSQAAASEDTRILCSGARVIGTTTEGDTSRFFSGNKVTIVELAVPADAATLVVGAATQGALGLALSP